MRLLELYRSKRSRHLSNCDADPAAKQCRYVFKFFYFKIQRRGKASRLAVHEPFSDLGLTVCRVVFCYVVGTYCLHS